MKKKKTAKGTRRKYSNEFKLDVVKKMVEIPIKELSDELGINYQILLRWKREFIKAFDIAKANKEKNEVAEADGNVFIGYNHANDVTTASDATKCGEVDEEEQKVEFRENFEYGDNNTTTVQSASSLAYPHGYESEEDVCGERCYGLAVTIADLRAKLETVEQEKEILKQTILIFAGR